jgi:hypothetical protein
METYGVETTPASPRRWARNAACLLILAALTLTAASVAEARRAERMGEAPAAPAKRAATAPACREDSPETLWFFDADFEDLTGDNAGWQSHDMSWDPGQTNYWHKDTIRINGFAHLGDSTWWCGTYNSWWRQPRGYGNNWRQHLVREFPLSDWSGSGDEVYFEWDQRFAMENDYDYGYVDFSRDYGASWTTLGVFANNGFAGKPGHSQDWDSPSHGHRTLHLPPEFAGNNMLVRFRFESDGAYSSQDQYNNPPSNSCLDGAWQLDNFLIHVNGEDVWYDDCESSGDNGWVHEDVLPAGQAGVTLERTYEPATLLGHTCGAGSGWMMAAVDEVTGRMVDGQHSLLISPPFSVSEAVRVVSQCDLWLDLPRGSEDVLWWTVAQSDMSAGLSQHAFFGGLTGWTSWDHHRSHSDRPRWVTMSMEWTPVKDWNALAWSLYNDDPMPVEDHTAGAFIDRVRVGAAGIDRRTRWSYPRSKWYEDEFSGSGSSQTTVTIVDIDGITSARTVATADGGQTWYSESIDSGYYDVWYVDMPHEVLIPGSEIHYYFEVTDGHWNVSTLPEGAPDATFEFSLLPIHGGNANPGILIVDKRQTPIPGDDRRYGHSSDEYVMEALDILGYEYDVYDAHVPEHSPSPVTGPIETGAYENYDLHIWITGDARKNTFTEEDQINLQSWLAESTPEEPRCLLISGNDIAFDLIEEGNDVTGFLADWLGATYDDRHAGAYHAADPDTSIRLSDAGLGFLTYDDGECWLRTACPEMQLVDVVGALPGNGSDRILEYLNGLGEVRPAGVARIDSVLGHRSVYLPFDIALVNEGLNGFDGHYVSGIENRVDLIANIMEFFERESAGSGTGVSGGGDLATRLGRAVPNPFRAGTAFRYALAAPGRLRIRVCDLNGRVVRTLVDDDVDAGEHRLSWDGTTDSGQRAASGVYFLWMETGDGFRDTRKTVLLK